MRAEPHLAFEFAEPIETARKPIAVKVAARLVAMWRAWRNRWQVVPLLGFDDRALRDIGLTRSDVTGALASPADEDPSLRLARAAHERRDARRRAQREAAIISAMATPSVPDQQPIAR